MTRVITALLERLSAQRYRALERSLTVGVGEPEARFRLGGRPNMSWHAAHLADAVATTYVALFGGDRPAEALPTAEGDAPWPDSRSAVLAGSSALLARLASVEDRDLAEPPQTPVHPQFREMLRTRQQFLEGHIYHVAYHVGSLAVLRAEQGLDERS